MSETFWEYLEDDGKTYSVWHRNGSGGEYSQWYQDAHGKTQKEAHVLADEILSESSDGWKSSVRVFADGYNPNE